MGKFYLVTFIVTLLMAGVAAMLPQGQGGEKKEPPPPAKSDTTAKLLKDLDHEGREWRAAAIDLLGERKAKEAIPKLIDLLTDFRALRGSDNWIGGHAANALSAITGRPFSVDQKEWRRWWKEQAKESCGK